MKTEEPTVEEVKDVVTRLLDIAWAPENAALCLQGAREAHRAGLIEEYLTCCERVVNLHPEWLDGWQELTSALFFTGRMRESMAAAKKAYRIKCGDLARTELGALPVRFLGPMWTGNIGHTTFLDSLAKSRLLGLTPPGQRVLLSNEAINPCYLNYWGAYFPLISDPGALSRVLPIAKGLQLDFEVWPFSDGRVLHSYEAIDAIEKQWEAENRPPLLAISEQNALRGRIELDRLGVPRDAWFVVLHVRQRPSHPVFDAKRTARNADIATYERMAVAVAARGGWVVCMGNGAALRPAAHVIDYGPTRTDWMDVFLWATCRFFVGTTSGPLHVPSTFGVPTVHTNSLLGLRSWAGRDLFIPKRHWLRAEQRYLTLEEELRGPAAWSEWPEYLGRLGMELRDNTPEEIEEVVTEMMDRLDGTLSYTEQEKQLQKRFQRLPIDRGCQMFGNSSLGRAFLRRHPDLLSTGLQASLITPGHS